MTFLELTEVSKVASVGRGRQLPILRGVTLSIARGSSTALLGRSGSGKSTLLAILGLLDQPTGGRYEIDGEDTGLLHPSRAARLRAELFGFVFQRFCLINHLSALENVEASAIHQGQARRVRRRRALEVLAHVGLADRRHHRPPQLSGGEQQRVAIARALAGRPAVVLADEPTGSLDQETGAAVIDMLHSLATEHRVTLVIVTHDPVIARGCDQLVRLNHGRAEVP